MATRKTKVPSKPTARPKIRRIVTEGFHQEVFNLVKKIPKGMLSTYGDIAGALGYRQVARHVGFALAALPSHRMDVPWHRVVNARGEISLRSDGMRSTEQIGRLLKEGHEVDDRGRVHRFRESRFQFPEL